MDPTELDAAAKEAGATAPEGTADHVDLVLRTDVRADLADLANLADLVDVSAPTLVISPLDDRLVPARLHREVAEAIPGARLVEIPGGHLPFVEQPGRWAELITGFAGE